MAHSYEYPRPALTVDCVVFGVDLDDESAPLKVLLIRRGEEPFKGCWALPGGHVHEGEELEAAALRELQEETTAHISFCEQLCTFGKPGRDPRGWVIAVAYYALVRATDHEVHGESDAIEAKWVPVDQAKELSFDHDEILGVALSRLRAKIRYAPIGFNLLPETFTLRQLRKLYETLLCQPFDKRNFRKRILAAGILVEAGVEKTSSPGPAATLYRFDKQAYAKAAEQGFNKSVRQGFHFEVVV